MNTLEQIARRVIGVLPNVDVNAAEAFARDAWKEYCEFHEWSFLRKEVQIVIPAVLSKGAVAVQFGSDVVQFNAQAIADLAVAGLPVLTERSLKIAGALPIRLVEYDSGTGLGKLEMFWPNDDAAASAYQIVRQYFAAPDNFRAWDENGLRGQREHWRINTFCQKAELDARDPIRQTQGKPFVLATHTLGSSRIWYELWPTPVAKDILRGSYIQNIYPLEIDTVFPPNVDYLAVLESAKAHAYEWAMANKDRFPALRMGSWANLYAAAQGAAQMKLAAARLRDLDTFPEQRTVNENNPPQPEDWLTRGLQQERFIV